MQTKLDILRERWQHPNSAERGVEGGLCWVHMPGSV